MNKLSKKVICLFSSALALLAPTFVFASGGPRLNPEFLEVTAVAAVVALLLSFAVSLVIKKFIKPRMELLVSVISLWVLLVIPLYLALTSQVYANFLMDNQWCSLLRASPSLKYECYFKKYVVPVGPAACENQKQLPKEFCYSLASKYRACFGSLADNIIVRDTFSEFRDGNYSSINNCGSIRSEFTEVDCYTQFALQSGDVSLCFRGKTYDGYSEGNCVAEVAMAKKDISICNSINSKNIPQNTRGEILKDKCIARLAVNTGNSALCNSVGTTYWKDACNESFALCKEF